MTIKTALSVLLLTSLLYHGACIPQSNLKGPPHAFQNIKLGLTSAQLMNLTVEEPERVNPQCYRIHSPTDKIEYLDCYFTKNGEHLYEIEITHYISDRPKAFPKFIAKCKKKYGNFDSRKQEEVEDLEHELVTVTWSTNDVRYEVEGRWFGKNAKKVVIAERIRDVGYLEMRKHEKLRDQRRDRRHLIESGDF